MASDHEVLSTWWSGSGESPRPPAPPPRTAGRYELIGLLGQGGGGEVHAARDLLTGDEVAVKRVAALSPDALTSARREATALRWARLPGVVRLRDDGVEGGCWFLVMDRVRGQPFPGVQAPLSWETLRPLALRLLEIVASIHYAGLVHRDLKPGNVLVERDTGRIVVLDFGLAREPVRGPRERCVFEGTPLYAAPEQIARKPPDPRSDLYAIGVMLYVALSGQLPHQAPDVKSLLALKLTRRPRSLAAVAHDVPDAVVEVVRSLLRLDRDLRPDSAEEVIEALGGHLPGPLGGADLGLPGERAAREEELLRLFHGPERFLRLQSRGAAVLHAGTGGEPGRVRETLARWVREGRGTWAEGALRLSAAELGRLEPKGSGWASALRGLQEARVSSSSAREVQEARRLCAEALAQERSLPLEEALYELGRTRGEAPAVLVDEEILVRAWKAAREGQWARCGDLLEGLGPLGDEDLEIWRQAARLRAAREHGTAAQEALLSSLGSWADANPHRRARWENWWGKLRYQQSRFHDAALHHEASAALRGTALGQARALCNAAGAWMEVPDLDRALVASQASAELAARAGAPRLEASLVWIQRSLGYRQGLSGPPRPELVDAARAVSTWVAGALALNEGAVAWRGGSGSEAGELAVSAEDWLSRSGGAAGAAVAGGLAALCGSGGVTPQRIARGRDCDDPGLAAQALALLGWAGRRPDLLAEAGARVAEVPTGLREHRLEVLTLLECEAPRPPDSS